MKEKLPKLKFPLLCFATFLLVFSLTFTFLGQGPGEGEDGGGNVGDNPAPVDNPTPGGPDDGEIGPVGQVNELFDNLAMEGDLDVLRDLLAAGADPNSKTDYGVSALHFVVINEEISETAYSQADILLQAGADPNLANEAGLTPLHAAAFEGSDAMVTALIKGGANPDRRDKYGRTPLEIALATGNAGAVAALERAGHGSHDHKKAFAMQGMVHRKLLALYERCHTEKLDKKKRAEAVKALVQDLVRIGAIKKEDEKKGVESLTKRLEQKFGGDK